MLRWLPLLALAVGAAAGCGPDEPTLPDGGRVDAGGRDAGPDSCETPRATCGGTCVNTETDARHCGGCGVACPDGAFCSMGMCTRTCPSGLRACGASCVDVATDVDHCGGCDMPCPSDRDCRGGSCVCPEGYIECDGTCVDPESDTSHCGVCGRTCEADEICNMASCECAAGGRETACDDGEDEDCDGLVDCEDDDCNGATRGCSGSCGMGAETCMDGVWGECEGGDGGEEICGDGIDQDCDGYDTRLPDGWEPNDTCDECVFVNMETDPNVFLRASFDSVYDDVDCYKFVADDGCCAREFIDLALENIPSGHDYDLYLYRNHADCVSRTALAQSTNAGNADDTISWGERFGASDSGTYYVRVTRYRGHMCVPDCSAPGAGCYKLTINGLRAP